MMGQIQYISDENNEVTAVIVPIELWCEMMSEKETDYLLKSEAMKKRLLDAKNRKEGIPFDKVYQVDKEAQIHVMKHVWDNEEDEAWNEHPSR